MMRPLAIDLYCGLAQAKLVSRTNAATWLRAISLVGTDSPKRGAAISAKQIVSHGTLS